MKIKNMFILGVLISTSSAVLASSAPIITTQPKSQTVSTSSYDNAVLYYRYGFDSTYEKQGRLMSPDSISGADTVLYGNAFVSDGILHLDGQGDSSSLTDGSFAALPADIISDFSSYTIETWARANNGNQNWGRVWDFGNTDTEDGIGSGREYTMLSWYNGIYSVKYDGTEYQIVDIGLPPAGTTTFTHIVYTYNKASRTGCVYVDGKLAGSAEQPADPTMFKYGMPNMWLGKSNWCDPYFTGDYQEFRIYKGVLSANEVKINYEQGPEVFNGGSLSPTITTQPKSQTVNEGSSVTFSVVATGTAPLEYQWKKDGSNIRGATSSSYTISGVKTGDAGNYTVTVSNSADSVTSSVAILKVLELGTYADAVLSYRYGFDSAYEKQGRLMTPDSISGADAALYGSAKIKNGYLSLDGTGDKSSFTDGCFAALPPELISDFTSFTVEMWARANEDKGRWMRLFDFGNCSTDSNNTIASGQNYNMMTWYGDGYMQDGVRLNGSEHRIDAPILPIGDGIFHHIVYVYDAQKKMGTIYSDGIQTGQGHQEFNPTQWGGCPNMWIGKSQFSSDPYFAGDFAEFRIYEGVLSSNEVKSNYDKGPEVFDGEVLLPTITTQPKSQIVNEGSSVTFSVVATGTTPLKYQWKKNGSNISGATSASYTISSVKTGDAGNYTVTVSNNAGSVTSSAATLTVNPVLSSISINGSSSVNVGSTTTYTCTATYSNGTSKTVTPTWAISSGAGYASITSAGVLTGKTAGTATVQAKYTDGGVSKTATKNVTVNAIKPTITTQPKSQTVNEGSSVTFSVTATGTTPLNYQWKKNGSNISGATSSSYKISSVKSGDAGNYTVTVSNSAGSVTSSAATLTVNVPVTLSSITINGNSSVNVDSTATYTCTATYSNGTTKTVTPTWAISSGANYASITSAGVLTGKAAGTATVQAKFTDGSVTKTATKNVTVNAIKPTITTQPKSQTVYEDSSVTFSVVATGTPTLTYQWKKDGSNINGATKSSYTISSAKTSDAGSYTVTVSNNAGSVTSSVATLTVNTKPIGTGATINMVSYNTVTYGNTCGILAGTKVGSEIWGALLYNEQIVAIEAFTLNSSGAPTGKLKGNVIGTDMVPVGTDVVFQLAAFDQGYLDHPSTGNYYYGISAPFTYHTGDSSNPLALPDMYLDFGSFTIEKVSKPTITTQPKSQTVDEGSSVTFSVVATGTAPLSYQWKKNGSNISGATSSTYKISSAKTSDAGSYTVTVSNSVGSVTSSAASLTVNKQIVPDGTVVRSVKVDGLTATVTLKLIPNDAVNVCFVEETVPPVGMITPNDGGVYTASKNVIRWSFLNEISSEVSYTVTVPSDFNEKVTVSGEAAFDTTVRDIEGETELDFTIKTHPADTNDDFEISMLEVSAYAVAWKQGKSWSSEPADIPMNYVARAALIWVNGGDYLYDPSKAKPSCWVNAIARAASEEEPAVSTNERKINVADGKADVAIELVPAEGISVYLVEEQLPTDVTLNVTDISDGGNYIPEKNVIRWSFLDGTPRTLTYTIEPEEGFVGTVNLNGEVMFDEETFTIEGNTEAVFRPVIHFILEDGGKTLVLNFVGTLYESEDTVNWTEVEGAESPFIVDTSKGKKFYRCAQ